MKITLSLCAVLCLGTSTWAASGLDLYQELKQPSLEAQSYVVDGFVLKKERVKITLKGRFTFTRPINDRHHGAIFQGTGRLEATPWSAFERDSVKRFLKKEAVDVDFRTAVIEFSDDTFEQIAKAAGGPSSPSNAGAGDMIEVNKRMVHDTGFNVPSRIAESVTNEESAGVFFAEFWDGGAGRFDLLVDPETRAIATIFDLNAGEKGVLFHTDANLGVDIWTTFFSDADHARGSVTYSDAFDVVSIPKYDMTVDLTEAGKWMRFDGKVELVGRGKGARWISFALNEGLDSYDGERMKKGNRITKVLGPSGEELAFVQEPWDSQFSVLLPKSLALGEHYQIHFTGQAEKGMTEFERRFYYPLSTTTWYPRHGYLQRSDYNLTFLHKPKTVVISIGNRIEENVPVPEKNGLRTVWRTDVPASFASFAVGPFERHNESLTVGDRKIPIEFYSLPGSVMPVKEDFILAEMTNAVNFYNVLFGAYPFKRLGGVFFPRSFGQGFPTMLFLPVQGYARLREFSFMAHEAAHQWWGNAVAWRSYRDQWLSEGFAEYSAALYSSRRTSPKEALELVRRMRSTLEDAPRTDTGIASGKLWQVGPLIMGHRLSTRQSYGAYTAMTYDRGALVLRMLHFLFTDPVTGDDKAFFEMMKDFVMRNLGGTASTESFFAVASEHFARTPIARRYRLQNLNWFLDEWVYSNVMPKYKLLYSIERGADSDTLTARILQQNAPEKFFMVLPLVLELNGGGKTMGTVHAYGPTTEMKIKIPSGTKRVRLDPDSWVLSEKTESFD